MRTTGLSIRWLRICAPHWRQQRFTRLWAGPLFLICSGLLLYFVLFAAANLHVFHLWLFVPTMFGVLKTLSH